MVRLLAEEGLPFVPRGAGTGLSGGALADDIIVIGLHRLKEILSLDVPNRRATGSTLVTSSPSTSTRP